MVKALANRIPFFRVEGRIRCLGHVFNLSVRAILRPFSRGLAKKKGAKGADDAGWADLLVQDLAEEDHDDYELDEEAEALDEEYLNSLDDDDEVGMQESRPICTAEDIKEAAFALFKVSKPLVFVLSQSLSVTLAHKLGQESTLELYTS